MIETTKEYIMCTCNHSDHMFILVKDEYDGEYIDLSLTVHLSPIPFLKRIKNAFLYVLGKRSRYGDFDEIILNRESVLKIQSFLEETMKNEKFK